MTERTPDHEQALVPVDRLDWLSGNPQKMTGDEGGPVVTADVVLSVLLLAGAPVWFLYVIRPRRTR